MLPAAASFKRQGANKGALASFLVSTPESGIDSIAITYALLDPIMTVVRPVAAFITGTVAGVTENFFSFGRDSKGKDSETPVDSECCTTSNGNGAQSQINSYIKPTFKQKFMSGVRYGLIDVWGDIVFWFFAGLLLAGLITVFIPDHLSEMVLGGGIISMFVMLLIGMPVYICATASTPVAAALLLKGASPGAVLVFLLAGPATNMTSLSVLVKILGKSGTARYLIVIAVSSIAFGLGVDWLYNFLKIEPVAFVSEVRETVPHSIKLLFALILIILSFYHLLVRIRTKLRQRRASRFAVGYPRLQPMRYDEGDRIHPENDR